MSFTDSNFFKNTDGIASGNDSSVLETSIKKKHKDRDLLYYKQTEDKNEDARKMTGVVTSSVHASPVPETLVKKKNKKKHKDRDLFLSYKPAEDKNEDSRKMTGDATSNVHASPLLETPIMENERKQKNGDLFSYFKHSEIYKNCNLKKKDKANVHAIEENAQKFNVITLEGDSSLLKTVVKKKKKHKDKGLILNSNQLIDHSSQSAKNIAAHLIFFADTVSSQNLDENKRPVGLLNSFSNYKHSEQYSHTHAVNIPSDTNITPSNFLKNTDSIASGNDSSVVENSVKKKKKNKHKDIDLFLYSEQAEDKNEDARKLTGDVASYVHISPLLETPVKGKVKQKNGDLFSHFEHAEASSSNFKKKNKSCMNVIANSSITNADVITLGGDSPLLNTLVKKKRQKDKDVVLITKQSNDHNNKTTTKITNLKSQEDDLASLQILAKKGKEGYEDLFGSFSNSDCFEQYTDVHSVRIPGEMSLINNNLLRSTNTIASEKSSPSLGNIVKKKNKNKHKDISLYCKQYENSIKEMDDVISSMHDSPLIETSIGRVKNNKQRNEDSFSNSKHFENCTNFEKTMLDVRDDIAVTVSSYEIKKQTNNHNNSFPVPHTRHKRKHKVENIYNNSVVNVSNSICNKDENLNISNINKLNVCPPLKKHKQSKDSISFNKSDVHELDDTSQNHGISSDNTSLSINKNIKCQEMHKYNNLGIDFNVTSQCLDDTEDPVDFEIPPLHECETVTYFTERLRNDLLAQNVIIKTGKFTEEEDTIILDNLRSFISKYSNCNPFELLGIVKHDNKDLYQFIKKKHFYVRLGKSLNNRTLRSIYKRVRLLLNPYRNLKKLNSQDRHCLKALQMKMGNKWTKISGLLEESAEKCESTYRWHEKPISKGKWSEEEEQLLIEAVKKVSGSSDISCEKIKSISWEMVAAYVPTRNFSQCRIYWANHLAWKSSVTKRMKWNKKCIVKLIDILRKNWHVESASMIDWLKIHESFQEVAPSHIFLQKRWLYLKSKIPGHKNLPYKDIIKKLCIMYNICH